MKPTKPKPAVNPVNGIPIVDFDIQIPPCLPPREEGLLTAKNVATVKAMFPELDHFDCAMLFIFLSVFEDPMAQAEKLSAGCKFSDAATALAIIRNKAHAVMIQKLNVLSNES